MGKIQDALARQDNQDKIYIGELIKRTHNGQYGEIFRALIDGLKTKELKYHQDNTPGREPLSADRVLGRMEAYQNILDELDFAIAVAEDLQKPLEGDHEE